jgi:hypothetical protein
VEGHIMSSVNPIRAVNSLLGVFSKRNQCEIFKARNEKCTYFYLNAVSRPVREGGPYAAGPTWMVFGVAGEGMDTDLMARAEMLIGEVDSYDSLAYTMNRHYTNTSPFYATRIIQKRTFLFMIQDSTIPLAVGQESLEARLQMELSFNMMSDAVPGVNVHPDAMGFAVKHHQPYVWDVPDMQFIDIPD